jgi:hypothetical protein
MGPKSIRTIQWGGLPLALAVVVASSSMLGQDPSDSPLLFRIVLPHSSVCVGDRQLEVESELRNISEHPVSLSPAGIRAQVSFTNRACSLDDGFRSNTISTDPAPGWKSDKLLTLVPGASYRQTLKLELDRDFFSPGVYRVQLGFSGRYGAGKQEGVFVGTGNSNEALFEVGDCASPPAKKR